MGESTGVLLLDQVFGEEALHEPHELFAGESVHGWSARTKRPICLPTWWNSSGTPLKYQ
jgi:hypothetical protein